MQNRQAEVEKYRGSELISNFRCMYRFAAKVYSGKPGLGWRKLKFFLRAAIWLSDTLRWVQRCAATPYVHAVMREPWLLERIHRPFLNAHFCAEERLRISLEHDNYTNLVFPELTKHLHMHGFVELGQFSIKEERWSIRLEIAPRFRQEGDWTLSIRDASGARLVSCAFCIASAAGKFKRPRLLIGCVQGQQRQVDGKALFKKLTKQWAGLRPKFLVVTLTQALAALCGVRHTLLVSDESHVFANSRYALRTRRFSAKYDAFAKELNSRQMWQGWHIIRLPAVVVERGAINEKTTKNKRVLLADIIAAMHSHIRGNVY
jgi:uncharacterized protein VirK/YbjX